MTSGDKIKDLRSEKKLSLRKLEQMTGLSKSTLSEIENNKTQNPTIITLSRIAKALNVSPSELIDGDEAQNGQDGTCTGKERLEYDDDVKQKFLLSVERVKSCKTETIEKINAFIDFMLYQEGSNR